MVQFFFFIHIISILLTVVELNTKNTNKPVSAKPVSANTHREQYMALQILYHRI